MVIFAGFKSSADTVFKPGIIKILTDSDPAAAVRQRCFIAAAKFVQQVGFGINDAFRTNFLTKIKADTPDSAFDPALAHFDTVAGPVIIAAQITQGKLGLWFDIPALVQIILPAVFRAQRNAGILYRPGDFIVGSIIDFKIIIHMAEFKYHIQIMAFIAELRIIETDRFAAVVAAAALITAAAVCIAQCNALITGHNLCAFCNLVITQFMAN